MAMYHNSKKIQCLETNWQVVEFLDVSYIHEQRRELKQGWAKNEKRQQTKVYRRIIQGIIHFTYRGDMLKLLYYHLN